MNPSSPSAPPPLEDMAERKAAYEKQRAIDFKKWKKLIEDTDGNVTEAAATERPDLTRSQARDFGHGQMERLGLVEYARELRVKAGNSVGPGRPKK